MRKFLKSCALVGFLASLSLQPAMAGYGEGRSGDDDNSGGSNYTVNTRTTDAVVRNLKNDFRECLQLFPAYRYDCYRKAYRSGAKRLKGSIDYEPAYEALRLVETRIAAVVDANIDPTQKKIRKGFQRFTPVNEAALPQLKRETIRAMEEAQTLLLRSPAAHQKPHFQKIAAVIDSNKVLLRSALLQLNRYVQRVANLRHIFHLG